MAFLDLRKSTRKVERLPHPKYQTELGLHLSTEDGRKIREGLRALSTQEGSELRTDFPEGWTLFWKLRSGDSRFLLAHPETDQWVGTLAFSSDDLQALLADWNETSAAGEGFFFSNRIPIARTSNLVVRVFES